MKILIIDDARFQRGQMVRMLAELGHTVIEAVNGQDGYLKLCTEGPDAVICDLLMPVMDGMAFLALSQKHQVQTPIIIASADVQTSTQEQCFKLGARAFINKPCKVEDIAGALRSLGTPGVPA